MSDPIDIHLWFSLTYSNYLVLPRSVLQSMPEEWQHRFTAMLAEMEERYGHLDWPSYEVRALKRPTELITEYGECEECDDGEVEVMGERVDCPNCHGTGETDEIVDHRYEIAEEVGFRDDPIPHYNRGRTVVPPREGTE